MADEDSPRDRQENELQALQAIYMDDCKDLREDDDNLDEWRPPEIRLRLTPLQSMGGHGTAYAELCLCAKMTVDYPNNPPELRVADHKGISVKHVKQLEEELKRLALQKRGEEMMFDLAQHVQTFLHTHSKPPMASFYDAMVKNQQAAEQKLEEERKRREERDRETSKKKQDSERRQIEEEIIRRSEEQKRAKRYDGKRFAFENEALESGRISSLEKGDKSVMFEHGIATWKEYRTEQSSTMSLASTSRFSDRMSADHMTIKRVQCLGTQNQSGASVYLGITRDGLVAVHEWKLHCRTQRKHPSQPLTSADTTASTVRRRLKQVESIERECASLDQLSHPNLVRYLGMNHSHKGDVIDIELVTEYVAGYSLSVMIKGRCQLAEDVVESYVRQLLEALTYLHSKNALHKDVKASSVFVDCKGHVQLADYCIYQRLANLYRSVNFDGEIWVSGEPEIGTSKKSDIYKLGLLVASLVLGDSVQNYHEVAQRTLTPPLKDFLMKCLDENERYRPSAQELLQHPFVTPGAVMSPPPLEQVREAQIEANLVSLASGTSPSQSAALAEMAARASQSRLFSDFEEVEVLGKGAFGEVFKVKNKLDRCEYAIKKIRLSLSRKQVLDKILSEVTLLSRLNHENIVRYFNSWIEDDTRNQDSSEAESQTGMQEPKRDDRQQGTRTKGVETETEDTSLSPGNIIAFQTGMTAAESGGFDVSTGVNMSPSMQVSSEDDIFLPHFSTSDDDSQSSMSDDDDIVFASSSCGISPSKQVNKQLKTDNTESDIDIRNRCRAPIQYLYIQMEYCGQNTLRNLIENGLYRSELRVWRVFREIVDGLAHVHRQGIIHRDLKPVNIFVDLHGHVKIGDFGLATQRTLASGSQPVEPAALGKVLNADERLTGQVGTALYISPELGRATRARYSQRVDIYSLGIIFFEMCHAPFNTTAERVRVISSLRREEIIFPSEFEDRKMKEASVIRWLLSHNPYDRPLSEELLHSEYMPLNMEDSQLHEVLVHTLSSPNTSRYRDMMDALFSQQPSAALDYTYDMQFHQKTAFSTLQARLQQTVRERLAMLCVRHGAVEVKAPLLLLKNSIHDKVENRVQLMDTSGSLLTLPYDLRVPFARFLARSDISHLKRYCLGQVYRHEKMHDAHPREPWECAFDIVTNGPNSLIPDAEVIYLVNEVIAEFPPLQSAGYSVFINHTSLLSAILRHCSVPVRQHPVVCNTLWDAVSGKLRWEHAKKQLADMSLSESTITSLHNFVQKKVPVDQIRSILEPVFRAKGNTAHMAVEGLRELEAVVSHLKAFRLTQDVVVWLGLAYKLNQFSGLMFMHATGTMKRKRHRGLLADVLAAGGRYDRLISNFQTRVLGPTASCSAVGVSIAVDKIVNAMVEDEDTEVVPGVCDVLVCSVGSDLLIQCIEIVRDLWAAGISSQLFENSEQLYSLDDMQTRCKYLGIPHIVLLSERMVYVNSTVRVRSLEKDKVVDKSMPQSELVEYIQSRMTNKPEMTEVSLPTSTSVRGAASESHSLSHLPVSVTVLPGEKITFNMKRRYQNLALSKASQVLQSLSNKQNVEVIAVDFSQHLLSDLRLILNDGGEESQFGASIRGIVDKHSLRSREMYLDRIIELVRDLRYGKKKTSVVFLYSITDDSCEILS